MSDDLKIKIFKAEINDCEDVSITEEPLWENEEIEDKLTQANSGDISFKTEPCFEKDDFKRTDVGNDVYCGQWIDIANIKTESDDKDIKKEENDIVCENVGSTDEDEEEQNFMECNVEINSSFEKVKCSTDDQINHLDVSYPSSSKVLFEKQKRWFGCSFCDYKTKVKSNVKNHELIHVNIKEFKCTQCDYECNQKVRLKLHTLNKHSNVKLYKCAECEYKSNYQKDLRRHAAKHSNVKLFKCDECDYECNQKGSLKVHLFKHLNVNQFKCPECDFETNRKDILKRHLLKHSNQKLYKCTECDYECNRIYHLKRHSLLRHSNLS